MGRLDTRLAKLEAAVGQADEARYWQAVFDLQPTLKAMYWQSQREQWPVLRYLDVYLEMHRGLPPKPGPKPSPEERERAIQEILDKLNGTHDHLEVADEAFDFGLDAVTQEIREANEAYLRTKEHPHAF